MTPEPCTTQARRLRHLSNNLSPQGRGWITNSGRLHQGTTLCGENALTEATVLTHLASFQTARAKPFVLADLPECTTCARAAQRSAS